MLEEFAKELELCSACPSLCQSACPVFVNDGNRSHAPWGIMQALNRVRKRELPFNEEIGALSYQCLTCRGCTEQCEHGVDVAEVVKKTRIKAVKAEVAPKEIAGFLEKFHKHNNPFSKDLLTKLKTILPERHFKPNAEVIYYSTCGNISKCPEVISDTFELFDKLGIDFVAPYADPIQCCGYPLLSAGAEYEFVDLAEVNYHSLKHYKTIITGSPSCALTLRETYKKYDMSLSTQIVTINEFLQPYLNNINYRLKKNIKTKIMFHDPCYLSRYLNQSELPRELIGNITGYPPEEFYSNRRDTTCSGQGGCYTLVEKGHADEITKSRLQECKERDIKTVVTQCPTCLFKMRNNSKRMVIKDLVSYLNDCIEGVND